MQPYCNSVDYCNKAQNSKYFKEGNRGRAPGIQRGKMGKLRIMEKAERRFRAY